MVRSGIRHCRRNAGILLFATNNGQLNHEGVGITAGPTSPHNRAAHAPRYREALAPDGAVAIADADSTTSCPDIIGRWLPMAQTIG